MNIHDEELHELFAGDPGLVDVAARLRTSRPVPTFDPRFQSRLRSQLMLEAGGRRHPRGLARLWRFPAPLVWAGGGVAAAMAAAVVLTLANSHSLDQTNLVTVSSAVNGQPAVTADLITVSFSEPMDSHAVISGLRLQPATAVRTSWRGTQLLIAPVHHLAPNTPYTVTIDERAARSARGGTIRGGVRITFGTAPSPRAARAPAPAPAPGQGAPLLDVRPLTPVVDGSRVVFGPDGSLLATRGLAPAPETAAPSASSAAVSPSPGPSLSPAPSPSAPSTISPLPSSSPSGPAVASSPPADIAPTPSAPPAPPAVLLSPLAPALVDFGADGRLTRLGGAASVAALSGDGKRVAAVMPRAGGADIVVGRLEDASVAVIAHSDNSATDVAWAAADRVLFASGGQIESVDLTGTVDPVAPLPSGRSLKLSPNGAFAFVGASQGGSAGSLLDLATHNARELPGSHSVAAFSPDGRTVAWPYGDGIAVSPTDRDELAGVDLPAAYPGQVTDLAVSSDRGKVAYVTGGSGGQTHTTVVMQVANGRVLFVGGRTSRPVFSAPGDRLGVIAEPSRGTFAAATAQVPSAPAAANAPLTIPPAAESVLNRFLAAQVSADRNRLVALSGGDPSVSRTTPQGLSRSSIVDAAIRRDGTEIAHVQLIVDPSPTHPAATAEETITLARQPDQSYLVRSISVGLMRDQPPGPHITQVNPASRDGSTTAVTFDSDLVPATVLRSITVRTPDGTPIAATTTYNPDTRTATVTIPDAGSHRLQLNVSTALTDINGQRLAAAFATLLRG